MTYYCWLQYYDADTQTQTSSDEIAYFHRHLHGVMPKAKDWNNCLADLVVKVNAVRASQTPPLDPLQADTIEQNAIRKTRSAY